MSVTPSIRHRSDQLFVGHIPEMQLLQTHPDYVFNARAIQGTFKVIM